MQTASENLKRELLEIFFAQSRIIWVTTIIIFILAVLIAFLWPPTYSATGSVLVRRKNIEKSPEALEEVRSQITQFRVAKEDLVSEMEMIVSPDLIERTVRALQQNKQLRDRNLTLEEKSRDFVSGLLDRQQLSIKSVDDPAMARIVNRIRRNITTEIVPASNVVKVTCTSKDPDEAVIILNALLEQYVSFRAEIFNPTQASFFAEQADRYRGDLEKIEDAQFSLIQQTGVAEPAQEIKNYLLLKGQLVQNVSILEQDAIALKLYVKRLEDALASKEIQFFSFVEQDSFAELRKKLEEIFVERGKILRNYREESSKVQAINRQLADTNQALNAEISAYKETKQSELKTINSKIENLRNRIAELDNQNVNLKRQMFTMRRLGQEATLLASSYETFAKRREETGILSSDEGATSAISLLHNAFPSEGPVFPKKGILIPFGLIVGFITGCSLGFIVEYLDHTFKKASDVTTYTDLPLIFSINKWN